MADIKLKDITQLGSWNPKELRKLRMVANNRIGSLEKSEKAKDLPESHPLAKMDVDQIKELLVRVHKAEKSQL
ncbi:MAG: hypothetical protein ACJAT2_000318 [Bacteriovoracaceae bacterium]|jgi:hypothetical protein